MHYSGFAIGIRMNLAGRELTPALEREYLSRAIAAVPERLRAGLLLHGGRDSTAAPGEDAYLAVLSGGGLKVMRKVAAALRGDARLAPLLLQEQPFIQNNRLARAEDLPFYGALTSEGAMLDGTLTVAPWTEGSANPF